MALITTIDEINTIYPTSRWDDIDSLLSPLQKVERTKLARILGASLLKELNAEYRMLAQADEGIAGLTRDDSDEFITVDSEEGTKDIPMLTIDILRACQEVIFYIMISNNIRILSSSLNRGGGFNEMTASDYDSVDEKRLDALKRETWANAMDSIESLLLLLEEDANGLKRYTDMWKESHYYYQHGDLLFRTAEELGHYLNIKDSRERYIELLPAIRNNQDNYIVAKIGQPLVDALIKGDSVADPIKKHVLQALANYISASPEFINTQGYKDNAIKRATMAADESHSNGDVQIALALKMIIEDAETFSDFIDKTQCLQYAYKQETGNAWGEAEETPTEDNGNCCCNLQYDRSDNEYSSLIDLGGLHLN